MRARRRRITAIAAVGIVMLLALTGWAEPVRINGGLIEGTVEDGIAAYKGIPFAAPPTGELRWRAPQPVQSWDGVLDTSEFAPACPQAPLNIPLLPKVETSEDCLYLNVWTPAQTAGEKLPVMVWIYGGGFVMGSTATPMYNGRRLAELGVVVVSVAYRVGPLGFLAHPDLTAESEGKVSGNYGLLDQIAGLKWVQRNITAFGGDPDCVTIFGESAGGISVSMLAASPLAKGLFHRAICQSGGSFAPPRTKGEGHGIQFLAGAEEEGVAFAKRMGAETLAELRQIAPEKWAKDPAAQMGGVWPVIDGYVIVGDQYKLYEAGKYSDVPVLIGTNSDEGSMFVRATSPEQYAETVRERLGPFAEKALELYPAKTRSQTFRAQADIVRDTAFGWPTWTWARLQSQTGTSDVYVYYFNQKMPSLLLSALLQSNGAPHGSEISYVFRNVGQSLMSRATEADKALSETMAAYWTNFAKTGNPNGASLPQWPAFKPGEPTVLYLNGQPHTGPVPNLEKLELIDEYFAWKRSL